MIGYCVLLRSHLAWQQQADGGLIKLNQTDNFALVIILTLCKVLCLPPLVLLLFFKKLTHDTDLINLSTFTKSIVTNSACECGVQRLLASVTERLNLSKC